MVGDRVIFFAVGPPGRFAEWCDGVIARLAETPGGTVATSIWPSWGEMLAIWPVPSALEEVALTVIRDAPTHLVMGARQPDERLYTVLAAANARFVVALDDPRLGIADMVAKTGADLNLAIRAMANCCPLMMRFAALPGALTVHAERAGADVGGTVCAIARHLGLGVSEARVARIVGDVAAGNVTHGFAAGDVTHGFAAADQPSTATSERGYRIIDGALAGYAEQFSLGGESGQIVWRRELFWLYAEGLDRPTGVIDVAGPPRTLVHGPYIHLPPGRWTARVVLGVSPEAVGNTFFLDAFADTRQLGYAVLVPARGGVHAVDIDFSIEQPSSLGLEIRVFVTNENARGQLALGHVVLQPLSMRQPDAISGSEDFETVLAL